MKKVYLALLLLPAISNVNIVFGMTDDNNDMNMSNIDSCPSFTMESEKELKELLRKKNFRYYNEAMVLAKKLANRTINPFELVNEVVLVTDDEHKNRNINDLENDEKLRYNRHKAKLIEAFLTNHPEAIECIEVNGNLRNIDPCRSFTMESEKELKELLKDNGFAYFDKKTKLSQYFANEEANPYNIYNEIINIIEDLPQEELTNLLRDHRFKYIKTSDMEDPARIRSLNNKRLGHLIKTLLTNHPEAIECLKLGGILVETKN